MDSKLPNFLPLLIALALASCEIVDRVDDETQDESDPTRASIGTADDHGDSVDIDFLLGMRFEEAAAMADQSMDVPPFFRVAAQTIDHPRLAQGQPVSEFKASGNVFLEIDFADPLVALCNEAEVDVQRVVLRGRPVLRRGQSVMEATSEDTVFFVTADSVDVEGPHRLRQLGDRISSGSLEGNPLLPAINPSPTAPATDAAPPVLPEEAAPAPTPAPDGIDPATVPAGMTLEQIQREISGE